MISVEELELKSLENRISLSIFLILLFLVIILGVSFVYHYQKTETKAKNELLSNNQSKITKFIIGEVSNLYHQLAISTDNSEVNTTISNHSIISCYNKKCKKFNLLKLGPILERIIPEYIFYKIKLNEELVYSNIKLPSYEIEKAYLLNEKTILTVGLSIDDMFWQKKQLEIMEPYKNILIALLGYIVLISMLFKYLLRFSGIKTYQYLKKAFLHQEEFLLKKIWSYEFKRRKELELNYLLIKKTNKLILSNASIIQRESSILGLPCNINLFQNDTSEKVSIVELKSFFSEIFGLEKNISISIVSQNDTIDFQSKELLYQLLNSILSYLAFCFEKTGNLKNTAEIKCYIRHESIRFECKGFTILQWNNNVDTQVLEFFKYHANVFILNLEQVFNILERLKFKCEINNGDEISLIKLQEMNNYSLAKKKSTNISSILPFKRK